MTDDVSKSTNRVSGLRTKSDILLTKKVFIKKKESIHSVKDFLRNKFIAPESWSYQLMGTTIIFILLLATTITDFKVSACLELNEDLKFSVKF